MCIRETFDGNISQSFKDIIRPSMRSRIKCIAIKKAIGLNNNQKKAKNQYRSFFYLIAFNLSDLEIYLKTFLIYQTLNLIFYKYVLFLEKNYLTPIIYLYQIRNF